MLEELLRVHIATLGPEHPTTLSSKNNLARTYEKLGRPGDALPMFEEVLRIRKAKLGLSHPDTLNSISNVALAYETVRRLSEALPLFEEAWSRHKASLGNEHPETLHAMSDLAVAYLNRGRVPDALPLFEAAVKSSKVKLGPDHLDTLIRMALLADAYQAAWLRQGGLAAFGGNAAPAPGQVGRRASRNGENHDRPGRRGPALGKQKDAVSLLEETLTLAKNSIGPDHPQTMNAMNALGNVVSKGWQAQ